MEELLALISLVGSIVTIGRFVHDTRKARRTNHVKDPPPVQSNRSLKSKSKPKPSLRFGCTAVGTDLEDMVSSNEHRTPNEAGGDLLPSSYTPQPSHPFEADTATATVSGGKSGAACATNQCLQRISPKTKHMHSVNQEQSNEAEATRTQQKARMLQHTYQKGGLPPV